MGQLFTTDVRRDAGPQERCRPAVGMKAGVSVASQDDCTAVFNQARISQGTFPGRVRDGSGSFRCSDAPKTAAAPQVLGPRQLIEIYRLMYLSRRLDDREIMLKRQQKIFFRSRPLAMRRCRSGLRWRSRPGLRLVFPLLWDRALCLALGLTPDEMMLQAVGAGTDPPAADGRCRPTGAAHHCTL